VQNTKVFEKSVMVAVLAAQLSKLSEADHLCDALRHPAPAPELAELLGIGISTQAKAMTWRGTLLHSGDMLFVDGQYQLAQAFALAGDGSFLLLGQAYRMVRQVFGAAHGISWCFILCSSCFRIQANLMCCSVPR